MRKNTFEFFSTPAVPSGIRRQITRSSGIKEANRVYIEGVRESLEKMYDDGVISTDSYNKFHAELDEATRKKYNSNLIQKINDRISMLANTTRETCRGNFFNIRGNGKDDEPDMGSNQASLGVSIPITVKAG